MRLISPFACLAYLLLIAHCLLFACSVPNLEAADCTAARDVVREFYSFHFGNDMRPTVDNIKLRERFITESLASKLALDLQSGSKTMDYFTQSENFPKAFRAGECSVIQNGTSVRFRVLTFWKDDVRSEQRPIFVTAKKEKDGWRIDDVSSTEK